MIAYKAAMKMKILEAVSKLTFKSALNTYTPRIYFSKLYLKAMLNNAAL
jgi:hypothetical protein